MKISITMRATAFLVAAQFLNVQINTSAGNEAMAAMNPEYRAAMAQAEARLGSFLEGKSEQAQLNFAYKVYKLGVKGRNRVAKMSEEKFAKRLAQASKNAESSPATAEETAIAQEANSIEELGQLQTAFAGQNSAPQAPVTVSKAQVVDQVDSALITLGSTAQENGKLSTASKTEFQAKVLELSKQDGQLRSPASSGLLKLLLKILIITVAVIAIAVAVSMILIFVSTVLPILFIGLVVGGVTILVTGRVHIRL